MSLQLAKIASETAIVTFAAAFQHGIKDIITYTGEVVTSGFKTAWNWLVSFFKKPDRPNVFIVGDPRLKDEISYKQKVIRSHKSDHIVEYRMRKEEQVITAIAVLPVSEDLYSPEVDIVEGGINWRHVKLRLSPHRDGQWGCDITICGS